MGTVAITGLVFALCAGGAGAGDDPFVQYLAGVEVLQAAQNLTVELRAAYYAKLCTLTGVTAAEALRRLRAYAGNPQQWKKIHDQMAAVLEQPKEGKE